MTTTDPTFTDRRAAIMETARATVAEQDAQIAARIEHLAHAGIAAATPLVCSFLESYGADITQTPLASGPCTDPNHALAWMSAAGFEFEIIRPQRPYTQSCHTEAGDFDVWLLHPETGERACWLRNGSRWETVAPVLVDLSPDTLDTEPTPEPEPRDHPAEVLVDALRAFVRSLDERMDGGF